LISLGNFEFNSLSQIYLKKIIYLHLRPGYLADNPVLTPRARFRFFRDAQDEAVSILLISLADQRATKGRLATEASRRRHERVARRLIKEYFKEKKKEQQEQSINRILEVMNIDANKTPIKITLGVHYWLEVG
jgi:hypothetical protein